MILSTETFNQTDKGEDDDYEEISPIPKILSPKLIHLDSK